jgi:predicted MFS family arabinose efflux permease
VERDLRTIFYIQALRAFAYGLGSILIGSVLASAGLSSAKVGVVFTAMLAGMAVTSLALGRFGHRFPRRRIYGALFVLFAVAGSVFAVTVWLPALIAAALTGTLSTDPNESGPITSIEQAMLGHAPAEQRARVFGRYNAVAFLAGSIGALVGGGPELVRRAVQGIPPDQRFLWLFPLIAGLCLILTLRLSPEVEAGSESTGVRPGPLGESKPVVRRMAALFALDAGAGGFIVQTFLVFWFVKRFGIRTDVMGLVFFAVGLLQAISSIVAGRLAGSIGLLNTMVFTHIPSNLALMLIPLSPNPAWAVALLLVRFALSQMDVPARQAFVVSMVEPHERTAAAAYTNAARFVVRPIGSAGAGVVMQNVAVGAPFVIAGGLKIVYDVLLYAMFRRAPVRS